MLVFGQKIGGMLIENKYLEGRKYSVVGIGLNVNQTQFPEGLKATSMALELNLKVTFDGLIQEVLKEINLTLDMVEKDSYDFIDKQYIQHLFGSDRWIEFEEESGRFFGQIRAVDQEGVLLVRSKQGRAVNYHANQVKIRY